MRVLGVRSYAALPVLCRDWLVLYQGTAGLPVIWLRSGVTMRIHAVRG